MSRVPSGEEMRRSKTADSLRKADAKAVLAALEGVLGANGVAAADIKGYIDPELVYDAGSYAKKGLGLSAARLAQLQEALVQLQAEGVAEGLKAANISLTVTQALTLEVPSQRW